MKIFLTLVISLACCVCLTAQTKNAEKAFNKGLDYFQENDYAQALDQFKSAVWADPDHEAAHHFLAQVYTNLGKSSFAIKHYKRVLAINSDNEDSWLELSKAYTKNDQKDKAVATLEKAVAANSGFHSVKLELDNLLNAPDETNPNIIEETIAYEPDELEIQPPVEPQIVSISDEPVILLDEPSHLVSTMAKPKLIPRYEFVDMVVTEPIQKEEVMAPAPSPEKQKKVKKDKKEKAGPAEKEEMATAVLNELLPAFEAEETGQEPVVVEEVLEIIENVVKEEVLTDVTIEEEIVEEADVEAKEVIAPAYEETEPVYQSTARIPGIRMPFPVDHVVKSQEKTKRTKKRKN